MASSTNRISKLRLALAFASFTVTMWLLAFTDHLVIAQLLSIVTCVATGDLTALRKPIAPRAPEIYGGAFAITLVVVLLASAVLGLTQLSNEWFLSWPYRALAMVGVWVIVVAVGCGYFYRSESTRTDNN